MIKQISNACLLAVSRLSTTYVGMIMITTDPRNPSTYIGGQWVSWGAGRIPVSVDPEDPTIDEAGKTRGVPTLALTVANMPPHAHASAAHSHESAAHTHTGPNHTHANSAHTHTGPSHTHANPAHAHAPRGGEWSSVISGSGSRVMFGSNPAAATLTVTATDGATTSGAGGTGATGSTTPGATGAAGSGATGSTKPTNTGTTTPGNTGSVGSGASISLTPPEIAVYMWKRVA